MPSINQHSLGTFLKDRRAKLDPSNFGFLPGRRRTPGLRREEVALLAHVSTTWYTWLEQGRGGAPSVHALERLAQALKLDDIEREHLFLLALGHPPSPHYQAVDNVTPRLQRVLDALPYSPAFVKNATWDVIAWNRAAAAVLTDYATLDAAQRNLLRLIFCTPRVRQAQTDWDSVARYVVATFRADVIRADASREDEPLVDELCHRSPEFKAMWNDTEVRTHGDGTKHLRDVDGGMIALEFSTFAVDSRPDLSLMIYNPATQDDVRRIKELIQAGPQGSITFTSSENQ